MHMLLLPQPIIVFLFCILKLKAQEEMVFPWYVYPPISLFGEFNPFIPGVGSEEQRCGSNPQRTAGGEATEEPDVPFDIVLCISMKHPLCGMPQLEVKTYVKLANEPKSWAYPWKTQPMLWAEWMA
eukprot:Gb_38326 [translate_table: standard]